MKNHKQKGNINDDAPMGQKNAIDQMNNPKPLGSLKESRHTGKITKGTNFLRDNQSGSNLNK